MAKLNLNQYALKILLDNDCDCYTYGNCDSEDVMNDLKYAYPNGELEYTYLEVANAILSISRPRPIERKPYAVYFETEDNSDGIVANTFEEAQEKLNNIYKGWLEVAPEDIDEYNSMIENCYAEIHKYNPNTDEYEEFWSPDDKYLDALGFKMRLPF